MHQITLNFEPTCFALDSFQEGHKAKKLVAEGGVADDESSSQKKKGSSKTAIAVEEFQVTTFFSWLEYKPTNLVCGWQVRQNSSCWVRHYIKIVFLLVGTPPQG